MLVGCGGTPKAGDELIVGLNSFGWFEVRDENGQCCTCTNKWEIIKENKSFMANIIDRFVSAVTPEPQKSFRKAGITNGDNIITEEGARVLLTWLLGKNQDAFKSEVVDGILADMSKEK